MAATRATAQGFRRNGNGAQQKQQTALGRGSVETHADTWRTFAAVTMRANGSGEFELRRDGIVLEKITWKVEV